MSTKGHYVSKFHLKQFTDPQSAGEKNPWVWLGKVLDGTVRKKGAENFAYQRGMFDGRGGLAQRDSILEDYLGREVETRASDAIKEFCGRPSGVEGELPPALMRYLAWAAARSLPMQKLEAQWLTRFGTIRDASPVEPPPDGLLASMRSNRNVQMRHTSLGTRIFPGYFDFESLTIAGWYPDLNEQTNFLETIHIQAYYLHVRFFPRFRWFTLHAPKGEFFVIADRAVGWAAGGYADAPPNCLRDPSAYVLAPLSRNLVLMGRHTKDPWNVTTADVNAVIAAWAHEWIAGPTEHVVRAALDSRKAMDQ